MAPARTASNLLTNSGLSMILPGVAGRPDEQEDWSGLGAGSSSAYRPPKRSFASSAAEWVRWLEGLLAEL